MLLVSLLLVIEGIVRLAEIFNRQTCNGKHLSNYSAEIWEALCEVRFHVGLKEVHCVSRFSLARTGMKSCTMVSGLKVA